MGVLGAIAVIATPALCAQEQYTHHLGTLGSFDLPADAKAVGPDSFRIRRGAADTLIEIDESVPHFDERQVDCGGSQPTYKVDKPKLSVYSCSVGKTIRYSVIKFGKSYMEGASMGTEEISFSIRYPASQQTFWGPVLTHMTQSLRFAN